MAPVGRREVLRGAGALAVSPLVGSTARPAQTSPGAFPWGVASFDPTASSVLLWTRPVPPEGGEAVTVAWSLAADEALSREVRSGEAIADGSSGHCLVVAVDGLQPGRPWWYRFEMTDGSRSEVGRTRTLPSGPVERLRVGVVSCSRFAAAGFAAYGALAERELDLVVHLGDYVYEDGEAGARPHDPPTRLLTLDQYRRRHAQHRTDADLRALHARHPVVAVWDDHDIAGNSWRDGAPGHDDQRDGPWTARLAAATQAREEWVPGRTSRDGDGRLRAWRALALGDLATLVVLDARSRRDRPPATDDELRAEDAVADGSRTGPGRSILGAEQEAFVAEQLGRADRAPWVLVANGVMLHPLRVPVPTEGLAERVEEAGFLAVDGTAVNPDQWDGFPAARQAFVQAAGDRGGVVVLTGDVHSSWAWEGPGRTDGGPAMVELVAPAVSSTPFADRLPVPASVVETGLTELEDDLSYVEASSRGYLLVDVDPEAVHAEWWHIDPDDRASERFAAARRAPRTVPMSLSAVEEPRPEPAAPPGPAPVTSAAAPGGAGRGAGGRSGGFPVLPVGATVAAVAAGAGALLRLRRRR